MKRSQPKGDSEGKSIETAIKLQIIKNGRFADMLFIIGSLINIIQFNEAEKAIFQTMANEIEMASNSEVKAAKAAEVASIIFVIAIFIFADNSVTTFKIDQIDLESSVNTTALEGPKVVAFSNLLKVIAYLGSTTGFHLNTIEALKKQSEQNSTKS